MMPSDLKTEPSVDSTINLEKPARYYLDLSLTDSPTASPDISSELAMIGLIRLLSDQWIVWPLLGTSRVYLEDKTSLRCDLNLIQTRLNYIQARAHSIRSDQSDLNDRHDYLDQIEWPLVPNGLTDLNGSTDPNSLTDLNGLTDPNSSTDDLTGTEAFTTKPFQEMSTLEKLGLIRVDRHWYSILDLYQSGNNPSMTSEPSEGISQSDRIRILTDPLTRVKLSSEINQQVHEIINLIPSSLRTGFPLNRPNPCLIETKLDHYPNGTPGRLVEFGLQTYPNASTKLFVWTIPDFRTVNLDDFSEYSQETLANLTLDAIELLVSKYTHQSLFQDKRYYQDVHLNLHPKMLYLCERSFENLHSSEYCRSLEAQIKDLEESLEILDQI